MTPCNPGHLPGVGFPSLPDTSIYSFANCPSGWPSTPGKCRGGCGWLPDKVDDVTIELTWRGAFTNREVNTLHAEAFGGRVFDESEGDWVALTRRHSLGGAGARAGG